MLTYKNPLILFFQITILPALIKAFGGPFWFAGFLTLIRVILTFMCTQLLGVLVEFNRSDDPKWLGIFYSLALVLTTFVIAMLLTQINHKTGLTSIRIQTAIIVTIYKKILRKSNSGQYNIGKIINMLAVDIQGLTALIPILHITWSGPLTIITAVYFLWQELGVSTLAGVFIMIILLIPTNKFMATKLYRLQKIQMLKKDERIKKINEIINGIKILKINSWESYFEDHVKKIRAEEIKYLRIIEFYNGGKYFIGIMTPFLVSLTTFATYVLIDKNNVLDVKKAFVSIALFNNMRYPLSLFSTLISSYVQGCVSLKRINKFLNSNELDAVEKIKTENGVALSIKNGVFSWDDNDEHFRINVEVAKASLTAVIGSVGSGKSSFISAFLGEMKIISGTIGINGTVAYMPQQSWIQNNTIQNNILFGRPMDYELYNRVLQKCALLTDIKDLPKGDLTLVGEKGI